MKTTVDIADPLLDEAKKLAAAEQTTLRNLVEDGLRRVIADRKRTRKFRLRRATFKGKGLQPDVAAAGWDSVRELVYKGRGT